jgi:hypothetical protein
VASLSSAALFLDFLSETCIDRLEKSCRITIGGGILCVVVDIFPLEDLAMRPVFLSVVCRIGCWLRTETIRRFPLRVGHVSCPYHAIPAFVDSDVTAGDGCVVVIM